MSDERDDDTIYKVVVNDEEQYSIWPDYKAVPEGWRTVGKSGLKKGASSVRFSVSGVSLAGGTYDPSLNSDIEGDSDGTSIRIAKP